MAEPISRTTLLLRLRPSTPATPEVYPVDVTLDGSGTFSATVKVQPADLAALESSPWEYGRMLGQALFASPELQRALTYARARGPHVSVALQVDAPQLNGLLWERLILATGAEELAFAASTTVALSRQIPPGTGPLPPRDGPFRLLLVISSPRELDQVPPGSPIKRIDIEEEIARLRMAWDTLVGRALMQVSILGRMPEALVPALERAGYQVSNSPATLDAMSDRLTSVESVHLIAHGRFKDGTASLLFENADGFSDLVEEQRLLARVERATLRLVFLQACQSATRDEGHPNVMSGLAPQLTTRAAAVVAMQDFVRVDDARRFSQEFYDTLLATGFADRAVNAGRLALFRPDSPSWAIPALYLAPSCFEPRAKPLWQPDVVLSGVQDLADQFRTKPDVAVPFPVEVIRMWADVSSKMETSPPGPRVGVAHAVTSTLGPAQGPRSAVVVIAGNYGRAKTAALRVLYADSARQVSRDRPLPFFAQISDFPWTDDTPERIAAIAIAATYKRFGIDLPEALIEARLKQPFILCLDGDQDADSRRRKQAFDTVLALVQSHSEASVVITLDEQVISSPVEFRTLRLENVPVLLVQLLSPATVAQYLTNHPSADFGPLLASIRSANLFDLAGVPWLLAQLMRQPARGVLSRSGVIARVVNSNYASANLPAGVRRLVDDLLGRIAWTLQLRQAPRLTAPHLYEVVEQVRGRRELQLDQLKGFALATKIIAPSDEEGVRFCYPGFQSYWCAKYLLDSGTALPSHLDDITATLGRRSRVRLWEDVLVLLAGMMPRPERLVERILAGGSMSSGEHAFLAALCIHEARLANQTIPDEVVNQVLDSLIWRSTPMKETSAAVRVRATESLALLKHPVSIPHLISLVIDRVRPTLGGQVTFELSALRHAAMQALLTMQDQAEEFVRRPNDREWTTPIETARALGDLIDSWRAGDRERLDTIFTTTTVEGLPAVVAFVLGTLGGAENLRFLSSQILEPDAALDTLWSIADSLLMFDPREVTDRVISRMRNVPALHVQAAYMIGRLRLASADSEEATFLVSCLGSEDVRVCGVALKALAQLGVDSYRPLCEEVTRSAWAEVAKRRVLAVPKRQADRAHLRIYALESLRLIGDERSLAAIREARSWRRVASDRESSQFLQLSYEVSEDIYCRITGELEDGHDDRPSIPT